MRKMFVSASTSFVAPETALETSAGHAAMWKQRQVEPQGYCPASFDYFLSEKMMWHLENDIQGCSLAFTYTCICVTHTATHAKSCR